MNRRRRILVLCGLGLFAIGASPRYLEELRIGGGFGEPKDGGADIDKTGAIFTDGGLTARGSIAVGQDAPQSFAASVTAGSAHRARLDLNQGNANNGGTVVFDGSVNKLFVGTRNASSSVTNALEIDKGSINVATSGDLTIRGNDLHYGGGASIRDVNTGALSFNAAAGKDLSWYVGSSRALLLSSTYFYPEAATLTLGRWDYRWGTVYAQTLDLTGDGFVKGGDLELGLDTGTRGVLTLWDGGGGAAPGCIRIASPNGTIWYLFVEDDGTVKIHNALPTSNSNGSVVGLQF